MTEQKAISEAQKCDYEVRVTSIDWENFVVTRDYRINRVNLRIKEGMVTDTYLG